MRSIWVWASLYFLCYIPFGALSKAISSGVLPGAHGRVDGATLLPVSTVASVAVMGVFLLLTGWWRHAGTRRIFGRDVPFPSVWTFLSGACTSVVLASATLAYTFEGVSIVFVMLLMRGGVLVMAPVVDLASGRRTRPSSWVGLVLSLAALLVAFAEEHGARTALTATAVTVIALYLAAYFIRLRLMSQLAKSEDTATTLRYFVEEQLVVAPLTLVLLGVAAVLGEGPMTEAVRAGFTTWLDAGFVAETAAVGVFSQLVGIFGTLIFLDKGENTFSVPVNRCSSVLSGVAASVILWAWLGMAPPSAHELAEAGLVVVAILVLSLAPLLAKRTRDTPAAA